MCCQCFWYTSSFSWTSWKNQRCSFTFGGSEWKNMVKGSLINQPHSLFRLYPPPSSSKLRFIFPRLISSFFVLIAKCFVLKLTDNFEHSRNPLWKGWYRPLIGPLFILYQDQRLLHSQHVHKPLMTLSSPEGPCDAVRRSTSAERLLLQVIIMMKTMLL